MSFSYKVKKELISSNIKNPLMELCGIYIFSGTDISSQNSVKIENDLTLKRIKNLLAVNNSKDYFSLEKISDEKFILKILKSEILKKCSDFKNASSENTENASVSDFVKGAFLACGSIANPEIEYHLEFNVLNENSCNLLLNILNSITFLHLDLKTIKRRDNFVLYIKSSDKITDFLTYMDSKNCSMEIMQIKMLKEVRNNVNRATNFETANLSKITNSSTVQINAIKKIKNTIGLNSLPEHLKETAEIRLSNPYISLQEMIELYKTPISKSGINHRLKKLIDIAKNL